MNVGKRQAFLTLKELQHSMDPFCVWDIDLFVVTTWFKCNNVTEILFSYIPDMSP